MFTGKERIMIYLMVGAFMLLDIVTGLIKSFKARDYTSSVMREGLYHKCGYVLCIMLAVIVDYAQGYMDLGINIPLIEAVCSYIALNEVGSIIENLALINPELLPDKLKSYFGKLSE